MPDAIARIETANTGDMELAVAFPVSRLTWLTGKDSREHTLHGPLLLDFKSRNDANIAIDQGLTVEGTFCRVSIYIPRAPQCFRCQDWGHRATECTGEAHCGKCAGNHETSQHTCSHDNPCSHGERCTIEPTKCANCNGDHASWIRSCPAAKSAFEIQVKKAEYQTGRYESYTPFTFADAHFRMQKKKRIASKALSRSPFPPDAPQINLINATSPPVPYDITLTLLNLTDPAKWDLILLQEPYIYPNSMLTIASARWFPLYPSCPPGQAPRSLILVSSNLSSNTFEQSHIPSNTVTAISIFIPGGTINLFNLYNPPDSDAALIDLQNWLRHHPPTASSSNIWLGDFNKHHQLWTAPEDSDRCRRSQTDLLIHLLATHGMSLSLPPATPTYQSDAHGTWSTIDLVDWEKFNETLDTTLQVTLPGSPSITPTTPAALDEFVHNLTDAIQQAIRKHVPTARPSEYTKRWWTSGLTLLRKEFARLSRLEFQARGTPFQQHYLDMRNQARNTYNSAIRRAKQDHWKNWLENANERDIWVAGKYSKNPLSDGGRTLIPTLHTRDLNGQSTETFDTAPLKAAALARLFFPPRPDALPELPEDSTPDPPPLRFQMPRLHQVIHRIERSRPFKAPGNDGILNIVLKMCSSTIAPLLHTCLVASVKIRYFPKAWRQWDTIVLRKPGRPDYSISKAYRPIALYNTMGKIISGVMTDIVTYITSRHALLPSRHFGGLPGRTTTDSLLFLTHKIKDSWRRRRVVTIIFLDIANTFPSAVTDRLLWNMAKLRYPTEIIHFFRALLTDRSTRLRFDDYTSGILPIDNGIGQGEPGSMLLYLIYNHLLVSIPEGHDQNGGAYIDDAFFMATADSFNECDIILNNMLDKQEVWSRTHNSKAEVSKFQCLRLTRKTGLIRENFKRTTGELIQCVPVAKLLGVLLDENLRWHPQASAAVKKSTDLTLAISRLARPSFGLPAIRVKQLFTSMVLPKMEYALPVWYTPVKMNEATGRRTGSVHHTREMAKVQRLGGKIITGAFRSTATDALDLHAFMPPIDIRLEDSCHRETVRLASLPKLHPLHPIVKSAARRQPRFHLSPIHALFQHFQLDPSTTETISPTRKHPAWQPEFTTHIAEDREAASRSIRARTDELHIFSDGSGIEGHIGAAAITTPSRERLRLHLGTDDEHTVFEGELVGVLLGLELIGRFPNARTVLIALDNQAAIRALCSNKPQPGQYLLDEIHDHIHRLKMRRRDLRLHLEWVPGHEGVEGNELADVEAKKAAEGRSSSTHRLPQILRQPLPISTAALKSERKKSILPRWRAHWTTSPRYGRLSKIDDKMPSSRAYKMLSKLPRRSASIITQLRTGHVALNSFLKKCKATRTALCPHCKTPETVTHFLIFCKKYNSQRRILKTEAGKAANSISRLLADPKGVRCTLRFIAATKRFKNYLDVALEDD
ncbi:hypothetical protein M422DRAFT_276688 [Sphaerobolus stellatus SS14]|uniref:Uncharacterized protein n=1 Tax=Sphaerobolus stellatus (strain SS14) TaxID=990650 RepID=A0A0C9U1E6_SPHS4|nr:hypothetical protein M422DRAFT_276688 [Sphaerobolus stellatus SS14]